MFKENDNAESLFIIQKGQIRLFRPKGKGYIDLAVLRTGEVIGEMAYFDEDSSRRSCSAEAIVPTEVIEISFEAFDKNHFLLHNTIPTLQRKIIQALRKEIFRRLKNPCVFAGDYIFIVVDNCNHTSNNIINFEAYRCMSP